MIDADYASTPTGSGTWCRTSATRGSPWCSRRRTTATSTSAFKRLCYAEYKGFFHIGMVTRNDRDAIIEHGTMTMIRRSVLDELRWPEWCITEDAELGLRVFEKSLSAAYFERSYGKG